jgi:iron complex transport system substrate-binding protein
VPANAPAQDFDQRFDALLANATRGDQLTVLRATHLLQGILIDLAEARTQLSIKPPWLEKTLARLDDAVEGDAPDYRSIAAQVGMSERTLRRRFRQATGLPPHDYLLQARIAEARRLLGETDLPTKVIAQKLGYRDVYFFSRQFCQLAGVPPASYRKSRQR